ncbi:MAG TPA: LysR substrate-binding domain-containing protein [Polyangiales bacterium]|nr:LysR substrate-binding domain-containing protein [Polyangiales bacterium]
MPRNADNIATFVEVVRQRSLSAAARSLGLPKSTVSRRLVRLEAELETKLLHRNARRVTLTAAGRGFYAEVAGPVEALDTAVAALERSSKEPRGTIRLTAPPDLGRMVLAPMFVAFLERYPEIALDASFSNRIVDLVDESVDLAVRAGRIVKGDLIARKLCDSELQLAAARTSVAQWPADAEPRSLERQAFVLYRASGGSQTLKLERAADKKPKAVELTVQGRINVDDYAAMAELVATGRGIGLMPAIHLREGVAAGKLVRVLPDWSSRSAHVYLVYPARQQPERVRLLAEFLIDAFARVEHV